MTGWASEAEMIAALSEFLGARGWTVYPEACRHDLIAVAGPDGAGLDPFRPDWRSVGAGVTVAIEGKLRASLTLLRQTVPPWRRQAWGGAVRDAQHADYYVACLPTNNAEFREVADCLGVAVWIVAKAPASAYQPNPRLDVNASLDPNHRCVGMPPLELPRVRVETPAGVPSPRSTTPWKLAAVALCLRAEGRGGVITLEDWKREPDLARRTFVDRGWVRRDGQQWMLLDSPTRPDRVYPEVVDALRGRTS